MVLRSTYPICKCETLRCVGVTFYRITVLSVFPEGELVREGPETCMDDLDVVR